MEYAQDLLGRIGPGKMFWGSDAPFVGHEHVASYGMAIDRFNRCVPGSGNASRYWGERLRFYFGD